MKNVNPIRPCILIFLAFSCPLIVKLPRFLLLCICYLSSPPSSVFGFLQYSISANSLKQKPPYTFHLYNFALLKCHTIFYALWGCALFSSSKKLALASPHRAVLFDISGPPVKEVARIADAVTESFRYTVFSVFSPRNFRMSHRIVGLKLINVISININELLQTRISSALSTMENNHVADRAQCQRYVTGSV